MVWTVDKLTVFYIEFEKRTFFENPCHFKRITRADLLQVLQTFAQVLQSFFQFQFFVKTGRNHFSLLLQGTRNVSVLFILKVSCTFLEHFYYETLLNHNFGNEIFSMKSHSWSSCKIIDNYWSCLTQAEN